MNMDKYNSFRKSRLKIEDLSTKLKHEFSDLYCILDDDIGSEAIFNSAIATIDALSAHLYYCEKLEDKDDNA
jgi:hypothetical protein